MSRIKKFLYDISIGIIFAFFTIISIPFAIIGLFYAHAIQGIQDGIEIYKNIYEFITEVKKSGDTQ